MYDHNSVIIVVILFAVLLIATEAGYRLGLRQADASSDAAKSQIASIQGSILGVLALLLGFTFSLALQRFDSRSEAVVDEANAIGTAILRADLLPDVVRQESKRDLRRYLELRMRGATVSLDLHASRDDLLGASDETLDRLWSQAMLAANEGSSTALTNAYVQALNAMMDSFASRQAALNRHVPETVLLLMFGTLVLASSMVGYSSGIGGRRTSFAAATLFVLIVCLVFVIIDLDRPRRGIIEVSQHSLLSLGEAQGISISPES